MPKGKTSGLPKTGASKTIEPSTVIDAEFEILEDKKKKKIAVDCVIVLDESGSMASVREDTIGGFNTFLKDRVSEGGEDTMTLTTFANRVHQQYTRLPVGEAPSLDYESYCPAGGTALFKAVDETITALENQRKKDKIKRDVIFVVITDGQENASGSEYGPDIKDIKGEVISKGGLTRLKERFKAKEAQGWNFIFLGADPEAWSGANNFGSVFNLKAGNVYQSKDRGLVGSAIKATSSSLSAYKASGGGITHDFYADLLKEATDKEEP
jgi:hypothetical protein